MQSFPSKVRLGIVLAAAGLAAAGTPALAQSQPDKPAEPPLKGPPVRTSRPPELEDRFAEGRGRDRAQPGAAMRELNAVLGKLRSEEAPDDVRLSKEQDEKIKAIQEDFRSQMRDFEEKQRELRKDGNQEQMEEVRQQAPRPRDAMTRIHAILTEPQKKFVEAEAAKVREQAEKRRADEYVRRRMEQRQGEPGAPGAPAGERPNVERFRRIAERLRELPPQQQERILRQLEESLDKAEAQAGTDRPMDDKPAADKPREKADQPAEKERARPQPRRKKD